MPGAPVQPASQHNAGGQRRSQSSQIRKHGLRDILRQTCVSVGEADRRRIDKAKIARDQFAKGFFQPFATYSASKFGWSVISIT